MVGLTQIRLDGNILQQINVLCRGIGMLDLSKYLCDERRIIVTTGLKMPAYTYHHIRIRKKVKNSIPLILLSLQT